jgi:hypothetical protein
MDHVIAPPRRRRLRLSAAVAGGLVLALAAGNLRAVAAEPTITLDDTQVADALFGAAVRLTDTGPDYYKSVVATAELLDWRAKHKDANTAVLTAHVTTVGMRLDAAVPGPGTPAELLQRQLRAVYATPGAEITGAQVTSLLAVVTARDLAPGVAQIEERLSGAQQRYALDVAYANVQHGVWLTLRNEVGPHNDGVLAQTWKQEVGKPTAAQPGVDPKWSLDDLKKVGELKNLVDIDALSKAGKESADKFWDELRNQLKGLQTKLNGEQTKLSEAIESLLTKAGVPGKPGERGPTTAQLAAAKKEQSDRQDIIDGVKTGLDVLVWVTKSIDAGFAKHLAGFAESAYKIATAANQLYTAIATLASATGIGATTFGAYGAVIGAAIGLIQVFVGLFSNEDPDAQQAAQKQVIDEVKRGFDQLKAYIEALYKQMNTRFDRIDSQLATIYQQMMTKFDAVIDLLYGVKGDLRGVHNDLLGLESQVQSFSQELMDAVSDSDKTEFLNAAQMYVDYEYQNGSPIPTYDGGGNNYVAAVNRFQSTATSSARNRVFVYTDLDQSDPIVAIDRHGPLGAIDYLTARAGSLGMPLPRSTSWVPNGDLWASAARAYTLTALQNPAYAAREKPDRTEAILAAGRQIQDAAQKFSKPVEPGSGPWVATNPLFSTLLAKSAERREDFANSLPDVEEEIMKPGRPIRLWDKATGPGGDRPAYNQVVNMDDLSTKPTDGSVNRLKAVPDAIAKCGGGPTVPTPDAITGLDLPRPLLLLLYADGSEPYNVCWANASTTTPVNKVVRTEKLLTKDAQGNFHQVTKYYMERQVGINVTIEEGLQKPGSPIRQLGRRTNFQKTRVVCAWSHVGSSNLDTPDTCPSVRTPDAEVAGVKFSDVTGTENTVLAGYTQATALVNEYRAKYYDRVVKKLGQNDLPSAKALNENLKLIQAYTAVGFPRASETDEQLHALVYGDNGLPGNLSRSPQLAAIFIQAAKNVRRGVSAVQDQPLLDQGIGSCVPMGRAGTDPVGGCVIGVGQARSAALAERFELHFKALHSGEEVETLPLVEEAVRNLELVSQYIRAQS